MATRWGLERLDPSARIVAALRAGRALYPPGVDGHFGPGGCAPIAEFLRAEPGERLP